MDATTLPSRIRSRFVDKHNGLTVHVLEAGFEGTERPCVLLLHGFPKLAYSWRKVMLRYRSATDPKYRPELQTYPGRAIDVPSCALLRTHEGTLLGSGMMPNTALHGTPLVRCPCA